MKRRWIIRSFFIALLLLCAGAWAESYEHECWISYNGRNYVGVGWCWGKLQFGWMDELPSLSRNKGWEGGVTLASAASDADFVVQFGREYRFGFSLIMQDGRNIVSIPFYFLTTLSALLLLVVWRRTRPRAKGRAFAVELTAKEGQA